MGGGALAPLPGVPRFRLPDFTAGKEKAVPRVIVSTSALLLTAAALLAGGCGGAAKQASAKSARNSAAASGTAGGAGVAPGRAAALAYARAVNLRAGDIPGASVTRPERLRPAPGPSAREFAHCAGAPEPGRRVLALSSAKLRPGGGAATQIGSSVEVMPSATLARRTFEAAASARGRSCLVKLLPEVFGRSSSGAPSISHLSIARLPVPISAVQSLSYRLSLTLSSKASGATRAVPLYLDVVEILHGPAEVGLTTLGIGRPPSAALERHALTLLAARAAAAKL